MGIKSNGWGNNCKSDRPMRESGNFRQSTCLVKAGISRAKILKFTLFLGIQRENVFTLKSECNVFMI
jgi:hypothetical protein